jgi:hypothetical protein
VLLCCGGLLTLALLALGPPLLPLLFGRDHAAAGTTLLALLPWFLLQHPTTLLQGALAAAGRGDRVLRANLAMLAALAPALAAAALSGSLAAFALARAAGEAARLAALLLALPPETRQAGLEALRSTPDRLPARPFAARFARPGRTTPAAEAAACTTPRSCSPP